MVCICVAEVTCCRPTQRNSARRGFKPFRPASQRLTTHLHLTYHWTWYDCC